MISPSYNGFASGPTLPGTITGAVGAGAMAAAPWWGPAVFGAGGGPIGLAIGAGVALIGGLLSAVGVGAPDLTKIAASNDANQIEQFLAQNQQWFLANPTLVNQQTAIANFNEAWSQFVQMMQDPSLAGDAGKYGVLDRQRGGKWDWFAMHLDPIANYQFPVVAGGESLTSTGGGLSLPLILGLGVIALGIGTME